MKRRITRYHAVKQIERRLLDRQRELVHSDDSGLFEAVSRAAGQAARIASLVLHGKM
jgi:tRNA G46 methylase TrmB